MNYKQLSSGKSKIWIIMMLTCFVFTSCKQEVVITEEEEPTTPTQSEPFVFEKNLLEKGEEFPVEVKIEIYEAAQLPIGEYYRNASQLVDARRISKIQIAMGAKSHTKIDEERIKCEIEINTADSRDTFRSYVNLKLEQLKYEQHFSSRYGQTNYHEQMGKDGSKLIQVVAISVNRKGWKQIPDINIRRDGAGEYSKPLRVKKSITPVHKSVKIRYYQNVEFVFSIREINEMAKVVPNTEWDYCDTGDVVVDITPWFKDVIGLENKSDLWVYYNLSSRVIIARSDIYLDTSLRHFLFKNCKQLPAKARVSCDLILVDIKASPKLEALQSLDRKEQVKRLARFSNTLRSGDLTKISLANGAAVSLNLNLYDDREYAYITIDYKDEIRSFILTDTVHMESEIVLHCGLIDRGERGMKTLLVLKTELIDHTGRVVQLPLQRTFPSVTEPRLERSENPDDRDPFDEGSEDDLYSGRFQVPPDFIELITDEEEDSSLVTHLVITPNHPYFVKDDVVLEITQLLMESGVTFKKDERALFNMSRNELCVFASKNSVEITENLVQGGCNLPRRQFRTHLTFYEVNSKNRDFKKWDMTMISLSDPKVIASGGLVSSSGEKGKIEFNRSRIELESTFSDDGYNADQYYGISLVTKDNTIEKSLKLVASLDFPTLVELENNGKRSVVMVIEMENGMSKEQKSRDLRMLYR